MKLQQRPEADDVRAMQQQLSSLHLLMEQSSSEHEREVERVRADMRVMEGERDRLRKEVDAATRDIEVMPRSEDINKYVCLCVYVRTYIRTYMYCLCVYMHMFAKLCLHVRMFVCTHA